jgi:hypothetical protein
MAPLLLLAPEFFFKVLFFDANMDYYTDDNVKAMLAVFLGLSVVSTPTYLIAAVKKYTVFIHIAIAQRLTIVLITILVTGIVIKQDVFEFGNFSYTMFLGADIVPAAIKGYLAPTEERQFQPNGLTMIRNSIVAMYKSTPVDSYKKSLRLESYLGMTFGFIAFIYAAIVSDIKLSLVVTVIVSILPYIWIWFIAHEPSFTSYLPLKMQRVAIALLLLYFAFVFDFGVMNIIYIVQAVNILCGLISSNVAAFVLVLSSLFVYKLECDHVLTSESMPFYWLSGWGLMTSFASYAWIYLFYDGYTKSQQERLMATHWQDNMLALFCIAVAGALDRAEYLRPDTLGGRIVYLVPILVLWLSLESKLLTHLWVGSPFHPSWWIYGDTKKTGQTQVYSPNDWVNITYSLATTLTTVGLTSYAWFTITKSVGFESYGFSSTNSWKFAVSHGILFIFHSGLWMIFANSGVPRFANEGFFAYFPPAMPPVRQCDPFMCKKIHRVDLVVGHIFLLLGTFWLGNGSNDAISPQLCVTKLSATIAWVFTISYKIYIHTKYQFMAGSVEKKEK